MAMIEDFTVFFNADEHADPAVLGGVPVCGIFDETYEVQDMGGDIASSGPAFTLASTDVPGSVTGLLLVVKGNTYKVVEPMPNGTGVTVLRLRT